MKRMRKAAFIVLMSLSVCLSILANTHESQRDRAVQERNECLSSSSSVVSELLCWWEYIWAPKR